MSSPAQIRRIHTLKAKAGLPDHQYRDVLLVYGAASSKDLDERQADRLIANLDQLAGARSPASTATGPYAGKLQALWIAGWNLGIVADRTDRAMLAFVERQAGVSHTRFLHEAGLAAGAIEGLKAWIGREGGVRWPASAEPRRHAMAVVDAIAARLLALGDAEVGLRPYLHGARHGLPALPVDCGTRELHRLGSLLGTRLRARLGAKGRATP